MWFPVVQSGGASQRVFKRELNELPDCAERTFSGRFQSLGAQNCKLFSNLALGSESRPFIGIFGTEKCEMVKSWTDLESFPSDFVHEIHNMSWNQTSDLLLICGGFFLQFCPEILPAPPFVLISLSLSRISAVVEAVPSDITTWARL